MISAEQPSTIVLTNMGKGARDDALATQCDLHGGMRNIPGIQDIFFPERYGTWWTELIRLARIQSCVAPEALLFGNLTARHMLFTKIFAIIRFFTIQG